MTFDDQNWQISKEIYFNHQTMSGVLSSVSDVTNDYFSMD